MIWDRPSRDLIKLIENISVLSESIPDGIRPICLFYVKVLLRFCRVNATILQKNPHPTQSASVNYSQQLVDDLFPHCNQLRMFL